VVPPEIVREDLSATPIAIGGGSPAIYDAVHNGTADLVVLATLENIVQAHIIAAADIHTVEDLRGKRLGYSLPGRANHTGLLLFAREMGWSPEADFTMVERASTIRDVTEGRADAISAGAVLVALAPEAGLNDVVDVSRYQIPFVGSGVNAERAWLAANRDTAARFVKSTVEALALMKSDRAAFDASVGKWFNITDSATLDSMYDEVKDFPEKPYPSVEGIRAMTEIYDTPQMRAHRAEDFYDSSFVEELDRSGHLDGLYR
jgi:NitT/TauT family transport system substrate-binding protein